MFLYLIFWEFYLLSNVGSPRVILLNVNFPWTTFFPKLQCSISNNIYLYIFLWYLKKILFAYFISITFIGLPFYPMPSNRNLVFCHQFYGLLLFSVANISTRRPCYPSFHPSLLFGVFLSSLLFRNCFLAFYLNYTTKKYVIVLTRHSLLFFCSFEALHVISL